jgi:type II secretory pathway component PulM
MSKGYMANLRPSERRLVVGIGIVFFVVINFWFIIPQFGEWRQVQARMWAAQTTLSAYQKEIAMTPVYERIVRQLESEGQSVPPEEQSAQFSRTIQSQQARSGVQILSTSRMQVRTNQFFLEQSQTIAVQAPEPQLIDFLYNLGAGNSLIRVRDLTLRPDPPRHQLTANVKLIASYQKSPATKTSPAGAPARATGAKTAGATSPNPTISTAKRQ